MIENTFQLEQAQKEIEKADVLAVDIETYGHANMNEFGQIRLIQIGTETECYVFDLLKTGFPAFLKPIFENPDIVKIFHYGIFDMSHLMRHLHVRFDNTFCTYLASRILSAGLDARNSLKAVVKRYLDIELDKEEQASDWSGDLNASQLSYAAKDVEVLLPLHQKLTGILEEKGLHHIARLEFGLQRFQARIQAHGLPISKETIETECRGIQSQFPGNFNLDELVQSGKKLPSAGLQRLVERYRLLGDLSSVGFVPEFRTEWREFSGFYQKNFESSINDLLNRPVFQITFKGLWLPALSANAHDYRSREHVTDPAFLVSRDAAMLRAIGEKDHRAIERYKYHIDAFASKYPGIHKWQEEMGTIIVSKKPVRIADGRIIHTRMFGVSRPDFFRQVLDTTISDFIKTLMLLLHRNQALPCQYDRSRPLLVVQGGNTTLIETAIDNASRFAFSHPLPHHLFTVEELEQSP